MAAHRILTLWATPRTGSTAFERMMIERGDLDVVNEPWSRSYYYGPHRRSDRFTGTLPVSTHAEIVADLRRRAEAREVFVKDMAYHPGPELTTDLLAGMTSTFIIRDPARALASLHRMWPDFTWEEAGYEAQARAYDLAIGVQGGPPVVLDTDDLRADPEAVVPAWCAAVGLPHRPDAMTWEPGLPPEWELWGDWYRGAADSTGFTPPHASPEPDLSDPHLAAAVARARPLYERLHAARLRV